MLLTTRAASNAPDPRPASLLPAASTFRVQSLRAACSRVAIMWCRAGPMIDEHKRRVVLKITCERCRTTWHLRLRADRWDQINEAEPTIVCMCGASFTVRPGKVGYVGRIPEPSVVAT